MFNEVYKSYSNTVEKYATLNPWTNVLGLSRSILAFGFLITLLFNDIHTLFPISKVEMMESGMLYLPIHKISIYYILNEYLLFSKLITILILLWVLSGYIPQVSCFFHWWVCFSYFITSPLIEGGDQIMSIMTLFLIPICIFDNRLNHWSKPKINFKPKIQLFVWSVVFIIQIQFSLVYFNAVISKLGVYEWAYGTAIYYWFTNEIIGASEPIRSFVFDITSNSYIVVLLTWGTLLLEFLLGAWIFMKRNKWNWKILFILGVCFHFGIVVMFGLVSFFFSMLAVLIFYFFPKENHINLLKYVKKN